MSSGRSALFYVSKVSSSSMARTPKLLWWRSRLKPKPSSKAETRLFFLLLLVIFSLDVVFYVRLSARLDPTRFAAIARCAVRPSRRIQCGAPDQSTRPRPAPTVVDRARATVVARPKAKAKAHSPELKPEFQSPGTGGSNNDNGDRLKCLEVDSRTGTMGRKSKKNVFSVLLEIQYNFKKFKKFSLIC